MKDWSKLVGWTMNSRNMAALLRRMW